MASQEETHTAYYQLLNVSPDASPEEIQEAYRRVSLSLHPDRHSERPDLHEIANEKFTKLQEVLDVLKDPKKRRIYDVFGEEGLKSGLEVGPHLKTPEAMRSEFERLAAKQALKKAMAKYDQRGVVEANVSLVHLINGGDDVARVPELGVFQIGHTLTSNLSERDTSTFACNASTHNGVGQSSFSWALRRQFDSDEFALLNFSFARIPGVGLTWQRKITRHSWAAISVAHGHRSDLSLTFTRQIGKSTYGKFGLQMGGIPGVKLRGSHTISPGLSCDLGTQVLITGDASCNAKMNWEMSTKSSMFAGARGNREHFAAEAGIKRRFTDNSAVGVAAAIGADGSIQWKLSFSRLGQNLVIPITFAEAPTVVAVTAAVLVPFALCSLAKFAFIEPNKIRRRKRKLERAREENAEATVQARREAMRDVELMRNMYEVRREREERVKGGGLIIKRAVYGNKHWKAPNQLPGPPVEAGVSVDGVVAMEVAIPLQLLVEKSGLRLYSASKANLPGFYDIAVGETKYLYVLYLFRQKLHEVVVRDDEPLVIPQEGHPLKPTDVRSW